MPPKGWRKNGDGVQPNKDLELVSIDDILFPRTTIQKLAKAILAPENAGESMSLTKDSLLAVQRSATVFVSHMMYHARQVAKDADRKNINSHDILVALERADLNGFVPEVKQQISTFEANEDVKKKQKAAAKAPAESDEPAAKKLKDNNETTVVVAPENDEEEVQELDEDATDDVESNDVDDVADDEEETPAANPIALLNEEQHELEGAEPADTEDANTDDE